MSKIKNWMHKAFKRNSLFFKIFCLSSVAVILVGVLTSIAAVSHSEKMYINTYAAANNKVITQVQADYARLSEDIIGILNTCNSSWACQQYLRDDPMPLQQRSSVIYKLQKQIGGALPTKEDYIPNLILAGFNETTFLGNDATLSISKENLLKKDFVQAALEQPDKILWQYLPRGFTSTTNQQSCVAVVRVLKNNTDAAGYGVAIMLITQSDFSNYFKSLIDGNINRVYVLDNAEATAVTSDITEDVGKKFPELLSAANQVMDNGHLYGSNGGSQLCILAKPLDIYGFTLVSIIDANALLRQTFQPQSVFLICTLIVLVMMILLFVIVRKTTQPITQLSKRMQQVDSGNFSHHIEVKGSQEVQELATAFNYMLDGLNNYVSQLVKVQEEKRSAEIHALQMQINPHFIYNTLACIKFLIYEGDTKKSIRIMDAFISLLRNTISNKAEMIPVEHEVENLENYAFIQEVRSGDRVRLHCSVSDDCLHLQIPKLLLQPMVENAFFHAFSNQEHGRIMVFIKRTDDLLTCEIIDNGSGMDAAQIQQLLDKEEDNTRHFTGIGVRNVNERIKLLYGQEYGIKITSRVGEGTVITVTMPAIPYEPPRDLPRK